MLWIGRVRWNFCATLIPGRYGGGAGQRTHGKITGPHDPGPALLALTGMTACLGAVVRAPLTSILIVLEMTRQISHFPP